MRSIVVILLLALAGCAGDASTDPQVELDGAVEKGEAAQVPVWNVGDYWTYEAMAGGQVVGTASHVVTRDDGADYIVEVNDKDIAYFDARFDISFLGEIRKSDLAGSQGSQRVEMFQWPLKADMEWTTTWDGQTLQMKSMGMGPSQFHVTGHRESDDRMTVEYHYNALKRWFEYIVFYDADNETETFRLDLKDAGIEFKGTIYRYAFGQTHTFTATSQQTGIQELTIDAEWNEIGVRALGTCGSDAAGIIAVGINTASTSDNPLPMMPFFNEPEWGQMADCRDTKTFDVADLLHNEGGLWEIGLIAASPSAMLHVFLEERALQAAAFP